MNTDEQGPSLSGGPGRSAQGGGVNGDNSRSVAIISAACGDETLKKCIASVQKQRYQNLHHYIVVDGPDRAEKVKHQVGAGHKRLTVVMLPQATGTARYNGHRIYGAFPFLVNADYVCFLDEDNALEPNHVSTLVDLAEDLTLDWAYSLRNIVQKEGKLLCRDDCDSLGIWGSWYGAQNHIDANCYLLKRSVAVESSWIWNRPGYSEACVDPDKALCRWLLNNKPRGFTTGLYTLNYRLGSSPESAKVDYFHEGNRVMHTIYKYFPWQRPILQMIDERRDYRRIVARYEAARKAILESCAEERSQRQLEKGSTEPVALDLRKAGQSSRTRKKYAPAVGLRRVS